jgi:hypothetical protein
MRRVALVVSIVVATGCARGGEPPPEQAPAAPLVAEAATSPSSCVRLDLTPLKVVRTDEAQRRVFVVALDAAEKPLAARIRDLESCFDFTGWAGRWHLSVFSDEAVAGYKDDPRLAAAVADGRWAKAYVAEYDAASKRVTRSPAGR